MAHPVAAILADADSLLRGQSLARVRAWSPVYRLAALVVVGGGMYGAAMGSFGGLAQGQYWQSIISALKVPWFLLGTFAISLPAYFLANTLVGLRRDFAAALEALLAAQAGVAIVLAALAPYTLFWYACGVSYRAALVFNLAVFGVASLAGQAVLRHRYRRLIAESPNHAWLLRMWLVIYAFVGVQMAWVLRPFVGAPGVEVELFRDEAWGNAYEVVWRLLWRTLTE